MQSMTSTPSAPRVDSGRLSKHSNKSKDRQQLLVRSTWTALCYYAALCGRTTAAFCTSHGLVGESCPRVMDSMISSDSDFSRLRLRSRSRSRLVLDERLDRGNRMTLYFSSTIDSGRFSGTSQRYWSIKASLSNTFYRPSNICPTRKHKSDLSYRSGSDYLEVESNDPLDNGSHSDRSSSVESSEGHLEQYVLDDYLEFLDKRYHRVHDSDPKDERPRIDTAWKWLFNHTDSLEASQGNHQDALYALGVANLASNRLLQKHQLSRKSVIEVPVETRVLSDRLARVITSVAPLELLAMSSVNIIRRVRNRRRMLLNKVKGVLISAIKKCSKNAIVSLDCVVRRRLERAAYLGAVMVVISTVLVIKPLLAIATSNH
eukprot:CAMPEP_0172486822 /NCGR_PEP_ID=MMETSP1066-20121228/15560_1 /TAXON_ID=671091 /ORGANISM="Coscinodiscus wailesii, Strain CCMP2513" /LENGTH=373 /DNA_ID=CAMNT_0013253015 /DNA_START=59 /DNA_END=1180 /DNA_ORIENTATION=-